MRIIGVIDVLAGQTVAACGGLRNEYQPIQSPLCDGSDPMDVARAFAQHCKIDEIYLADLDRLSGRPANLAAWKSVSQVAHTKTLWLDAGIRSHQEYSVVHQQVAELTNDESATETILICASESWNDDSHDSTAIDTATSPNTARAFSLDLRHGELNSPVERWQSLPVIDVAREMIDAGWSRFIVLDVAAVGQQSGCPTIEFCRALRALSDDLEIVTGGGIRDQNDLLQLERAGCDAALISTALHSRRLP